ncbi:MAG: DUF5104 domain-containing protein [Clostridia bacterium]|nr:DUF5104 domain-containing protein [Clostridia bacterium]
MKKTVLIVLLLLMINACSSCLPGALNMYGGVFNNDREIANEKFERLIDLIQEKDKEAVKKLFAPNVMVDGMHLDESINALFEYYQGELVSYNDWGGPGTESSKEIDGSKKEIFYCSYDVITTEQTYRIAMKQVITDTQESENVGLWSFYIIRMGDDINSEYAYRGDGKYAPGVNIGIARNNSLT